MQFSIQAGARDRAELALPTMARRLARHPAVLIAALAVSTLLGAAAVGSLVQMFVVGTSRLGLDSPAGVAVSIVVALLSMATIGAIMYVVMRGAGGYDDDDFRRGDDDDRPPPPSPDGPWGEPEWWPEFEAELGSYLSDAERRRVKEETPVVAR